ncbi:winged helix DNA-binding domain-containing protein [Meredithblackwellia eburnea MCA 4105]
MDSSALVNSFIDQSWDSNVLGIPGYEPVLFDPCHHSSSSFNGPSASSHHSHPFPSPYSAKSCLEAQYKDYITHSFSSAPQPPPPSPTFTSYSYPYASSSSELGSSSCESLFFDAAEHPSPSSQSLLPSTPSPSPPALPSVAETANPLPFIAKLSFLLSREEYKDVISWDAEGLAFVVAHNSSRFKTEVLPKFFSHTNPSSFTRQLNVYNFMRLPTPDLLERVSLPAGSSYTSTSAWKHPSFYRDAPKHILAAMAPRPSKSKGTGTIKAKRNGTIIQKRSTR